MVNQIKLTLFFILSLGFSIACMDKKEKEQKSISEFDKHIFGINQVLQSAGLITDLCKIIGEYDGLRPCQLNNYPNSTLPIIALTYISDIKYLASASWNGFINFWDLDKSSNNYHKCVSTVKHNNYLTKLIYIEEMKCLVYADCKGTINLSDPRNINSDHNIIATFDKTTGGHALGVTAMTYISYMKCLASSSHDKTVKLWDLDKESKGYLGLIGAFTGLGGTVYSLEYISDTKCLACGSEYGVISLWNLDKSNRKYLKCVASAPTNSDTLPVHAMIYISDLKYLVSVNRDLAMMLWDVDKEGKTYCKCIATLNDHTDVVNTMTYISQTKCLVSASNDGTMKLWDLNKESKTFRKCIATFDIQNKGRTDIVHALTHIPDLKHLVSGSENGIKIWINMSEVLGNFDFPNISSIVSCNSIDLQAQSYNRRCVIC